MNALQAERDELCPEDVRQQLGRIVSSATFRDSHRLSSFLRFVVEATLARKGDRIKAYTIAVDALGRGSDFDPQADAIVRVEAGRLRSALARYYAGAGRNDPLVIALPRGSYVPTFSRRHVEKIGPPAAARVALAKVPSPALNRPAEILSVSRQLGSALKLFHELAEVRRLRSLALAAEIMSAQQALTTLRTLLAATDNYIPSRPHLTLQPLPIPSPCQADAQTMEDRRQEQRDQQIPGAPAPRAHRLHARRQADGAGLDTAASCSGR